MANRYFVLILCELVSFSLVFGQYGPAPPAGPPPAGPPPAGPPPVVPPPVGPPPTEPPPVGPPPTTPPPVGPPPTEPPPVGPPPTTPPPVGPPPTEPPPVGPPPTIPPPVGPPPTEPPPVGPSPTIPPPVGPPPTEPPPVGPPPVGPPPTGSSPTTPPVLPNTLDLLLPEYTSKIKLTLSITYDAMEEKSQLFFNTTLLKNTFGLFYPYIEFDLIPCQEAQILNGDLYCFSAADPFCYLNRLHACAINQVASKLELTEFIMCTMQGTAVFPDYNQCASAHQIDVTKLKACADSDTGKQLCINYRKSKVPGCNTIPGFMFKKQDEMQISGGVVQKQEPFDHFVNNACNVDFKTTVCGQLRAAQKTPVPKECDTQIIVGVFYKIIDETSQKWFESFEKVFEKFQQNFIFRYTPCMFAEYHNGQLDCKSGDDDKDCVSGKMHSCAIALITDPLILYKFITCTMKDPKKLDGYEKCATDSGAKFSDLKACADSDFGKFLCYDNSKRRPKTAEKKDEKTGQVIAANIAFSFNSNYIDGLSAEATTNLEFALCQQLRYYNATLPDECKKMMKLSIFYGSMDYDFQCFMSGTFVNVYDKFYHFVEFDFVPCRGAKEENGDLTCRSSAAPKCEADKFGSCALKNIPDKSTLVKFLLCTTQDEGQNLPSYQDCATSIQIDINTLQTCATGADGKSLCIENLKKSPKSDHGFAFQVNDKYDPDVDQKLHEDFQKGLCNLLKDNKVPFPNDCYQL